ncbi:MAG: hypothetical protein HOV68_29565, partial [Streptomycetaceae bacterium]|nr:hypothetical protein [Streptomycetaceae bacterium]
GPASATLPLRRLLTAFPGTAGMPPPPPRPVVLAPRAGARPRPVVHHGVHIATAGMGATDCLVALNHLLVEAVLDGRIGPGDALTLRQSPSLVGLHGPFAAIRVMPDATAPERLQAHACLTAAR